MQGAKTDSDLARPPGGDHPAAQRESPGIPFRRERSTPLAFGRRKRAHPSSSFSACGMQLLEDVVSQTTLRSRRSWPDIWNHDPDTLDETPILVCTGINQYI